MTKSIVKSETYAFRYRAYNKIGPGPWSDISKLEAATVPIPPPRPFYISSSDTTITMGLLNTQDNGGSRITQYKIFRDAGNLSSPVNI